MMAQPQHERGGAGSLIAAFTPERPRPLLALAVMGGVFAEGIDLPGERLSGAGHRGGRVSPDQPGAGGAGRGAGGVRRTGGRLMGRLCLPRASAGPAGGRRVIRGEEDRGAVLLIDERYFQPAYEAYLPGQWQVRDALTVQQAARHLAHFWAT